MSKPYMLHLVANYPNPQVFKESLQTILNFEPEYLEIQYPFTNPLADGKTIYDANQVAVKYTQSLEQILQSINQIVKNIPLSRGQSETLGVIKTKLILMTYFTPLSVLQPQKVVKMLVENNFVGMIVPDLTFGTPEQKNYSKLFLESNLELIPVIAPNTPVARMLEIKEQLKPNQVIYATARAGQTGQQTNLNQEILEYLETVKTTFEQQKIALGFGISTKEQVTQIQNLNVIPVIGSAIVKSITNKYLSQFLNLL
jgi:tryptophan synthase alpha chain